MIIRKEQMNALGRLAEESFLAEMVLHLQSHFPRRLAGLNPAAVHVAVVGSLGSARGYGLTTKQDLCRFLNLVGLYGWDFDLDPKNAWMKQRLEDDEISSPSDRLSNLTKQCMKRLETEQKSQKESKKFGLDTVHGL